MGRRKTYEPHYTQKSQNSEIFQIGTTLPCFKIKYVQKYRC